MDTRYPFEANDIDLVARGGLVDRESCCLEELVCCSRASRWGGRVFHRAARAEAAVFCFRKQWVHQGLPKTTHHAAAGAANDGALEAALERSCAGPVSFLCTQLLSCVFCLLLHKLGSGLGSEGFGSRFECTLFDLGVGFEEREDLVEAELLSQCNEGSRPSTNKQVLIARPIAPLVLGARRRDLFCARYQIGRADESRSDHIGQGGGELLCHKAGEVGRQGAIVPRLPVTLDVLFPVRPNSLVRTKIHVRQSLAPFAQGVVLVAHFPGDFLLQLIAEGVDALQEVAGQLGATLKEAARSSAGRPLIGVHLINISLIGAPEGFAVPRQVIRGGLGLDRILDWLLIPGDLLIGRKVGGCGCLGLRGRVVPSDLVVAREVH